jgi:hypothetical protein
MRAISHLVIFIFAIICYTNLINYVDFLISHSVIISQIHMFSSPMYFIIALHYFVIAQVNCLRISVISQHYLNRFDLLLALFITRAI